MTTPEEPTTALVLAALGGERPRRPLAGLTFSPAGVEVSRVRKDLALDLVFVPASAQGAEARARGLHAAGAAVFWVVDGPLWPVLARRGVSRSLRATLADPSSLEADLDRETVRAQAQILGGAAAGADVIVIAEDLAGAGAPLVMPEYAAASVFPRLKALVDEAVSVGLPAVMHSDGDIIGFLPAVKAAGFIGVHAGGMTAGAFERLLRSARGLRLSVVGGIFTSDLHSGSRGARSAGLRVRSQAQDGGLLASDDGGITSAEELGLFAEAIAAFRTGR